MRGIAVALAGAAAFDPAYGGQELRQDARAPAHLRHARYQAKLRVVSAQNAANALAIQAADPEREFVTDLCWNRATAAPATSASTTGRRRATASSSRCCSPRATARRSPATCGRRRPGRRSALAWSSPTARSRRPRPCTGSPRRRWPRPATSCSPGTRRARASPTRSARAPDEQEGFPAQTDGPPVLRRHRGRAGLLPLHARAALRAAPELHSGTSHARQAGARRGRAQRRLQPVRR